MAFIGGYIGFEPFYDLSGELQWAKATYRDISLPAEAGTLLMRESPLRAPISTIVGRVDFTGAAQFQTILNSYAAMVSSAFAFIIQRRYGNTFISYPGFKILDFDVMETHYYPVAVGGVNGGNYELVTSFKVQYSFSF